MALDTEVLVIGGSAAGMAAAVAAQQAGHTVEILEATAVVGTAWRHHYQRLHLHTPKSTSGLPGLKMRREWPRYPGRDQVVQYLERYRDVHGLQPHYRQRVTRLERRDGRWLATTEDHEWRAGAVVIATGATRVPIRPTWAGMPDYRGEILHSSDFVDGERWRGRSVLVVGFGNSACEQAIDLVEHGASTHMSVRSPVNVIPRDLFGLVPVLQLGILLRRLPPAVADALAWPLLRLTVGDIRHVGLARLPYGPITQIARDRNVPVLDIGTLSQLRAGRITVHPDVERFTAGGVVFADGTAIAVDAVVLGTGYRPGLEEFLPQWREVCDEAGRPLVSGAPTALAGLYFCGQHVSPAGMLREIGIEARRIAAHLGHEKNLARMKP